jgi:GNAT superfamily N-acetyltransferase
MIKKVADFIEIDNSFVKIKNYKKKLITNFFPNREKIEIWISKNEFYKIEIGEVIYFLRSNLDFYTLFFIASSNEELDKSLSQLLIGFSDEIFILDIVQREEFSDVLNIFYDKSFNLYTSLVRMNRLNHRADLLYISTDVIKEASRHHLISLNNMLHSFFDEKAEQLPDEMELENWIENKNILIYEEDNQIGGFLIYEIIGNTLYLRYWFVHPDFREKRVGSKLFNEFEIRGKETNRHLFWVIRSNENAIKRYKHYGFVEEKMYNFVLTNKNIKYEE